MRKIWFRAKSKVDALDEVKEGEWICGGYADDGVRSYIAKLVVTAHSHYFATIEIDKSTLGQYTGLKDMDGREIFEGDIVEADMMGDEKERFEVRWSEEKAKFGFADYHNGVYTMTATPCRVIGNIYDEN